jgi:hypothetical protein
MTNRVKYFIRSILQNSNLKKENFVKNKNILNIIKSNNKQHNYTNMNNTSVNINKYK